MEKDYELRAIANENTGLYYKNQFCGLYFKHNKSIIQFSGNKYQIFDVDICANYLLQFNDICFSNISVAGHQKYLQVSIKPFVIEQGILTIHNGRSRN